MAQKINPLNPGGTPIFRSIIKYHLWMFFGDKSATLKIHLFLWPCGPPFSVSFFGGSGVFIGFLVLRISLGVFQVGLDYLGIASSNSIFWYGKLGGHHVTSWVDPSFFFWGGHFFGQSKVLVGPGS